MTDKSPDEAGYASTKVAASVSAGVQADASAKTGVNLPRAYQDGRQDFYGRDFLVTPDVLIPRPESEMLIDEVLTLAGKSYLPGVSAGPRVLPPRPVIFDVGTGSGCLAITLKLELPETIVVASDISRPALEIAKANALRLKAPLTLIISHLLDFVKSFPRPDLIVANLPYVDREWDWLDLKSLAGEPEIALFAKNHGLALIFELITQAATLKIPRLVLEADPCQHPAIIDFAAKHHYQLYNTRGFCLSLYSE